MRMSLLVCHRRRGATLIEVLIAMLVIVIASIATLTYFGPTRGYIGKSGNRRAALERARERLEQLLQIDVTNITPAVDLGRAPDKQLPFWISCPNGNPCALVGANPNNQVSVDSLPTQPIQSLVQWKDDLAAGTATSPDVLEFSVKVWFMGQDTTLDDDFHRVHLRTLRTTP